MNLENFIKVNNYSFPDAYTRVLELGLVNLEPWYFLTNKDMDASMVSLSKRYPDRKLLPFARRQDNDDYACFSVNAGSDGKILIIHNFASPGWELAKEFDDFWMWFRAAIEDMIEFS